MPVFNRFAGLGLATLVAVVLCLGAPAQARSLNAVTNNNLLLDLDSANPSAFTSRAFTGLQAGESIMGIDYRPANGALYGLGSSGRLYQINVATGAATAVGGAFSTPLSGNEFGFDFNPVTDTLRISSDTGINWRINPVTGLVTVDTAPSYAPGDAFAGVAPGLVGLAYDNNVLGAASTNLYGIDHLTDSVVRLVAPNTGVLNTVGNVGVVGPGANRDIGSLVGFDIVTDAGVSQGFAALTGAGAAGSGLFTIDLNTGAASSLGSFGSGIFVRDIALPIPAAPSVIPLPPALLMFPGAAALAMLAVRRMRQA